MKAAIRQYNDGQQKVNMDNKSIKFSLGFRFPIKQTGENSVEVTIPMGEGTHILSPRAAEILKLSEAEFVKAELAALKAIAVIE